jgi:hypothetical protein
MMLQIQLLKYSCLRSLIQESKLAENGARRTADPAFYAMVKEAARELDREDKAYSQMVENVEKDVTLHQDSPGADARRKPDDEHALALMPV